MENEKTRTRKRRARERKELREEWLLEQLREWYDNEEDAWEAIYREDD